MQSNSETANSSIHSSKEFGLDEENRIDEISSVQDLNRKPSLQDQVGPVSNVVQVYLHTFDRYYCFLITLVSLSKMSPLSVLILSRYIALDLLWSFTDIESLICIDPLYRVWYILILWRYTSSICLGPLLVLIPWSVLILFIAKSPLSVSSPLSL